MKFIFISFFSFFFLFSLKGNAQEYDDTLFSYSRNSFELKAGTGFGWYAMKNNDPDNNASIAVTGLLQLEGSYYLSRKFNAGIMFERVGFLTNKDSTQKQANTFNMGLSLKYFLKAKEKSSIFLNLTLGTSSFKYKENSTSLKVSASSYFLEPGIGFIHYWSKNTGIYIVSSYYFTKYSKIVNKDNSPLTVINNNGGKENYWISMSGIHFNIGFVYKF